MGNESVEISAGGYMTRGARVDEIGNMIQIL